MDSDTLAGILKNFYSAFDMSSFQNRLKLQKIVYLIQTNGINLGFGYNFYLYGPYSTDLARAGFQITDYSKVKIMAPEDKEINRQFMAIKDKLGHRKDDIKWLECATSIIYLKRLGVVKNKIIDTVAYKLTKFPKDYINSVWRDLEEVGWIDKEN